MSLTTPEADTANSLSYEDMAVPRDDRLFMKSVEKTFAVLEAFGESPFPLSLAEIARLSGLDKSAAQRICHTLLVLRYLERDPVSGKLVPGKQVLDRSYDYLRHNPLVERAVPILIELRKSVQERVDLSLFDGGTVIFAHRLQSKREFFTATLVGRRIPSAVSSGGRACLAHLPNVDVRRFLTDPSLKKFCPKTTMDLEQNFEHVMEARRSGHALAVEEMALGEIAIGAPIVNAGGYPVGAISVAASLAEWELAVFAQKNGPLVMAAAQALSGK